MIKSPFAYLTPRKQGSRPTALQAHQELNQKQDAHQELRSIEEVSIHRASLFLKELSNGIPKAACVFVAVWDYIHTRDLQRFMLLLGATQAKEPARYLIRILMRGLVKEDGMI